jgi:hypothetical protein
MIYKYKAIHIPTQRVFEREVLQGYMYASGTRVICGQNDFNELLSHWNYQASLQSPVVWMYAKTFDRVPVYNHFPELQLNCNQAGQDPPELEINDPID